MRTTLAIAVILLVVVGLQPEGRAASSQAELPQRPSQVGATATLVVTNTADSGPGTLRQALLDARPGDTITFDPTVFPPAAPATITLAQLLPELKQGGLVLDASNAGVILDGSQLQGWEVHGLDIVSDGNVVRGLQILNFPSAAIGLRGGASDNVIGGDPATGAGPLGQGNLLSGSGGIGVGLWDADTTGNRIEGNRIGTDLGGTGAGGLRRDGVHIIGANKNRIVGNVIGGVGQSGVYLCCVATGNTVSGNRIGLGAGGSTPLGNGQAGVNLDQGAHANQIGPDNQIAHNPVGVVLYGYGTQGNTVTRNRIFGNAETGIRLDEGGNTGLAAPVIIGFDLSAGTVEGASCANCTVEVFSTAEDQGDQYEGQATAEGAGYFRLDGAGALTGPHLTATATDAAGNTSPFSNPTRGESRGGALQQGNTLSKRLIATRASSELAQNYLGDQLGGLRGLIHSAQDAEKYLAYYDRTGYKWTRLGLDTFDWSDVDRVGYSHKQVDLLHDYMITALADRGVTILFCLVFWDDQIGPQPQGWSRFRTEAEIQRYLDYARFIVEHFRGRVQYYEILNETYYGEGSDYHQQNIALPDYVNLVKRVAPVIHQADPQAKIVAGPAPALYDQGCYDYELGILSSDAVMPLVDAVSWHPGPYPASYSAAVDHLYQVPETIQELQDTAEAHGFQGQYIPEEIQWPTAYNPSPSEPWNLYSETLSAKYFGRGILDHRGLGLPALLAGTAAEGNLPKMDFIRNLATLLAGVEPAALPVKVASGAPALTLHSFSLGDGGYLLALWQDGFAQEEDAGVPITLTVPSLAGHRVTGFDLLYSFQQPLVAEAKGGDLVLRDLLARDYPLLLRISPVRRVFVPLSLGGSSG